MSRNFSRYNMGEVLIIWYAVCSISLASASRWFEVFVPESNHLNTSSISISSV